jgi:hypothetical protein
LKSLFTTASVKKQPAPTDEAVRIRGEVDKTNAALAAAHRELIQAEANLGTTRTACGEIEASVALGATADGDPYQQVRTARDQVERITIRIAALNERIKLRFAELRVLADPLSELEGQIASRYRAEWLKGLHQDAAALRNRLAEGLAIDQQLNLAIAAPLVMARLDDPEMSGQNLLGLYEGFGFSKSATELHTKISEELAVIRWVQTAIAVKEVPATPERTRPDVVPSVYTLSKVS